MFQLGVAVVAALAESDVDLVDEMVFTDVEGLRPRLTSALGAGVAVAAAVGRTSVVPVRVQPSAANAAVDQAGQGEPVRVAVGGWPGRPDLLSGDEVLFGDERRMGGLRRQGRRCGWAAGVGGAAVPGLAAGVARVRQDHGDRVAVAS